MAQERPACTKKERMVDHGLQVQDLQELPQPQQPRIHRPEEPALQVPKIRQVLRLICQVRRLRVQVAIAGQVRVSHQLQPRRKAAICQDRPCDQRQY